MDYDIYARPGYYFGYAVRPTNELLEQLARTGDGAHRNDLLAALQRKLADDAVNVFLFELPKLGVWRRDLHGLWREAPVQGIDVSGVWLEGAPAAAAPVAGARVPAALAGALARSPHSLRSWRCGVTSECATCSAAAPHCSRRCSRRRS